MRPTESLLVPLQSPRDTLPEGRTIHSLTLTYKLNVSEAGKHTPSIPLLNRHARTLYKGFLALSIQKFSWTGKLSSHTIYDDDDGDGDGDGDG